MEPNQSKDVSKLFLSWRFSIQFGTNFCIFFCEFVIKSIIDLNASWNNCVCFDILCETFWIKQLYNHFYSKLCSLKISSIDYFENSGNFENHLNSIIYRKNEFDFVEIDVWRKLKLTKPLLWSNKSKQNCQKDSIFKKQNTSFKKSFLFWRKL